MADHRIECVEILESVVTFIICSGFLLTDRRWGSSAFAFHAVFVTRPAVWTRLNVPHATVGYTAGASACPKRCSVNLMIRPSVFGVRAAWADVTTDH